MSHFLTLVQTLSAPIAGTSDIPSWLQSIIDFLGQVIAEIPILILDLIEFILKLVVAVG